MRLAILGQDGFRSFAEVPKWFCLFVYVRLGLPFFSGLPLR